jgi:hypothetical protein
MTFHLECLATAIGSLSHGDPGAACEVILRSLPEIPIWSQLPHANFRKRMEIQYSEGLPRGVFSNACYFQPKSLHGERADIDTRKKGVKTYKKREEFVGLLG